MITHRPIKISLRQMVDNPAGSGGNNTFAIKSNMNSSYITILRRYRNRFIAMPYIKKDGTVIMHVKVPSEIHDKNSISYDVIFTFEPDPEKKLEYRNIKCFSNCPSFVFTYAYVFNAKGILADEFKNRLPQESIVSPPTTRNPIESLGYEKSIYIAARYLLDSGALNVHYIKKHGKSYTDAIANDLYRRIANISELITIYQQALYLERKKHRTEVSEAKKREMIQRQQDFKRDQASDYKNNKVNKLAPKPKLTARKAKKAIKSTKR